MHEGRHLIGFQSFMSASLCLPVEIYSNASRWPLSDSIVRRPGTCGCCTLCSAQQRESACESSRFVESEVHAFVGLADRRCAYNHRISLPTPLSRHFGNIAL
jgi:hypothetical protein